MNFQGLTAKSIRLTGAQLPITGDCNMALTCEVGGLFSAFAGALINNNCTISSVLTVGTISPPISGGLILNGYGTTNIALGNTVAVTGSISMPGYTFCSGLVSAAGVKLTSTGQASYTSSRQSTGIFRYHSPQLTL